MIKIDKKQLNSQFPSKGGWWILSNFNLVTQISVLTSVSGFDQLWTTGKFSLNVSQQVGIKGTAHFKVQKHVFSPFFWFLLNVSVVYPYRLMVLSGASHRNVLLWREKHAFLPGNRLRPVIEQVVNNTKAYHHSWTVTLTTLVSHSSHSLTDACMVI